MAARPVARAWSRSPARVARRPRGPRPPRRRSRLDADERERARPRVRRAAPAPRVDAPRVRPTTREVVLVMGIPGAGKSRVAEDYVARGYVRLNRDERGGSLRELADALEEELASGVRRVVLDNTYLTRAARSHVIDAAGRHGLPARCVWLDTPLAQAQVNLVERLLDRLGSLPSPEELRVLARRGTACSRRRRRCAPLRELEPPSSRRGMGRARAGAVRADAAVSGRPEPACSSRPPPWTQPGWRDERSTAPRRTAPGLRLAAGRRASDALAPAVAELAAEVSGPRRGRALPTRRRTAELLVPAAAARAAARVRARARGRPVALGPRRDGRGTSHARHDARRPVRERRGLTSDLLRRDAARRVLGPRRGRPAGPAPRRRRQRGGAGGGRARGDRAVDRTLNALAMPLFDAPLDHAADGPFAGVPFLIKNSGPVAEGVPFTMGSDLFEGAVAPCDLEIMRRFRAAGLATLGVTNVPEMVISFATESRRHGITRNPWNPERGAGGSSGGSAALVAAGACRSRTATTAPAPSASPSSCCGLVGLKPSRGRTPAGPHETELLFGMGYEFALARTVRDMAHAARRGARAPASATRSWRSRRSGRTPTRSAPAPPRLRVALATSAWSGVPVDPECADGRAGGRRRTWRAQATTWPRRARPSTRTSCGTSTTRSRSSRSPASRRSPRVTPSPDTVEGTTLAAFERARTLTAVEIGRGFRAFHAVARLAALFFERPRPARHADPRPSAVGARTARVRPPGPLHGQLDRRDLRVRAVHRAVQHRRAAGDQRADRARARTACPSACRSSPRTAARTCCSGSPRSSRRRCRGPAGAPGCTPPRSRQAGSVNEKALPPPSTGSTQMTPSCASTTRRQTARPIPLPSGAPLTRENMSKMRVA